MAHIDLQSFSGVKLFEKKQHDSALGHFTNLFEQNWLDASFVQDSISSCDYKGTIKGFHFQRSPFDQAKLVSVLQGSILDIFIDLRKASDTFLDHGSINLKEGNSHIIFLPRGFAHGYITLENQTVIHYKLDNFYSTEHEETVLWKDNSLDIEFPKMDDYHLSSKDQKGSTIKELSSKGAFYE
jgi:dTDP-4-dehydrorhamnose 3,5-epimerase